MNYESWPQNREFYISHILLDTLENGGHPIVNKIHQAAGLLNNTRPYLEAIKLKKGSYNTYYLKLSTQVVGNALAYIIDDVNTALEVTTTSRRHFLSLDDKVRRLLIGTLREAWKVTQIMDTFDVSTDFKNNRYDPQRSSLKDLCEEFGIISQTQIAIENVKRGIGSVLGIFKKRR